MTSQFQARKLRRRLLWVKEVQSLAFKQLFKFIYFHSTRSIVQNCPLGLIWPKTTNALHETIAIIAFADMEEQVRQSSPGAAGEQTTMETNDTQITTQTTTLPPRPVKTWREHFHHSLPHYTGPYNVGYLEMELPATKPRTFGRIKREHKHALQLDTVLFSIYYPTNDDPTAKDAASHGPTWLPRPRVPTAHGYAKEFSLPSFPVTAYMASTCMLTKLPASRNAKVAQASPSASSEQKGAAEGQQSTGHGRPMFPVVMFSHGLGGSRMMYSTVCGDLASYGFVVVALEHRDGSGARSYVNVPPDRDSPELNREDRGSSTDGTEGNKCAGVVPPGEGAPEKARSYMVDYLFPKGNAADTSPHNEQGVDRELRSAQIDMRLAEFEEAFGALKIINAGDPEDRIRNWNLRRKPNRGASSKALNGIDWADWKGRLSLQDVTAMGHSFGGATTVQIMRLDDRFPWIGQGILLDAWGPATPDVPPGSEQTISKPLLSIGSEAFMHWQDNFEKVTAVCTEASQCNNLCWMLTVRGTTHLSQADFAVLYPKVMSLFLKTLVNPSRGIYLTIALTLEFLKIVLPPAQTTSYDTSGWVDDGLLRNSSPIGEVPVEHRPADKHIAERLKIEHESTLRLKRWWNLKWHARGRGSVPEDVPTDNQGRPLYGLKTWGPGEEIWVHMCPTKLNIERRWDDCAPMDGDGNASDDSPVQRVKAWRKLYPLVRLPTREFD